CGGERNKLHDFMLAVSIFKSDVISFDLTASKRKRIKGVDMLNYQRNIRHLYSGSDQKDVFTSGCK
ncbi:hypothetical protein, partial [Oceanobacter antarcticus]